MIEYDYLCEAITAWKEGRRPGAPPVAAPDGMAGFGEAAQAGAEPEYAEAQPEYAEAQPEYAEAQPEYAEAQPEYAEAQPEYAEPQAGYEDAEPDMEAETYEAVPEAVEGGGTAPVVLDELEAEAPAPYQEPAPYSEPEPTTAQQPVAAYEVPVADADLDVEMDDDDDDDEEDDFERDYDLEEVDDMGGFDFVNNLAAYFQAETVIEAAWEDKATRITTLNGYGVRDEKHYYQVKATLERYVQSPDAEARYGGLDAIMQLQMNAVTDAASNVMQARAEGELASEFEPVEGIALEQWAHAQAAIASGAEADPVIAQLGIDRAHWDRVSAEWNARMSRDTTATVATAYGNAFSGAGQGQFAAAAADGVGAMAPGGDVGDAPPVPMDRYVEIMVAQSAAADQGRDANEVLAHFGINAMEWGQIGAWWGAKMSRHGMENGQALFNEYNALQEKYEAQYGVGDADEDVEF